MQWKRFLFVKSQKTWLISLFNKQCLWLASKTLSRGVSALYELKSEWNLMPTKAGLQRFDCQCGFALRLSQMDQESQNKTDPRIVQYFCRRAGDVGWYSIMVVFLKRFVSSTKPNVDAMCLQCACKPVVLSFKEREYLEILNLLYTCLELCLTYIFFNIWP